MDFFTDTTTLERTMLIRASQLHTPLNGSIELLPLCNMNCDMCYVRLSHEEMEQQGRMRVATEWIEIGKQMKEAGVLFLLLTGGEPLLYPEFRKVYLEFQKMGFILTINTNGTLLDEEWALFLCKHKPRRVNITLYGANKDTYEKLCHYSDGFEKTIHAVHLLKKHNVDVKINGSLTCVNKDDIDRILDIGHLLDVPVNIDTYMMPATREREKPYNFQSRLEPEQAAKIRIHALKKEMGKELFEQYVTETLHAVQNPTYSKGRNMSCLAGKCSFTINWQGEIRPCVILKSPAISVFEVGFLPAWKYIVEETDKILLNEKCGTCHLRPICRTCAACALLEEGSYDAIPAYMCRYAEESYRLLQNYVAEPYSRVQK